MFLSLLSARRSPSQRNDVTKSHPELAMRVATPAATSTRAVLIPTKIEPFEDLAALGKAR